MDISTEKIVKMKKTEIERRKCSDCLYWGQCYYAKTHFRSIAYRCEEFKPKE